MKKLLLIVVGLLVVGGGCAPFNKTVIAPPDPPLEEWSQNDRLDALEYRFNQLMEAEGYIEWTETRREWLLRLADEKKELNNETPKTYLTKDLKKKEWMELDCDENIKWFGSFVWPTGTDMSKVEKCGELNKELGL